MFPLATSNTYCGAKDKVLQKKIQPQKMCFPDVGVWRFFSANPQTKPDFSSGEVQAFSFAEQDITFAVGKQKGQMDVLFYSKRDERNISKRENKFLLIF